MPNFHPDTATLNDYTAGTLSTALAIAVKAHIEMCAECRKQSQQIAQAGAYFIENAESISVSKQLLAQTLDRINNGDSDRKDTLDESANASPVLSNPELPVVIQKLLIQPIEQLPWRKLSKKLKFSRVKTGDKKNEFAFYDIKAGGSVPHHTHHSDEVTLILKGSFSDEDGVYRKGDYLVRTQGERHSISATQNEDCLCLAVQETPIAFTGWFRILNPLLKVEAN